MTEREKLLRGHQDPLNYSQPPQPPQLLRGHQDPRNYNQPPPPYSQAAPQQTRQNPIVIYEGQTVVTQLPPNSINRLICCAITAVIFFFPLGLIALYMAIKAKKYNDAGNIRNARTGGILSRMFSAVSIFWGNLLIITTIVVFFIGRSPQ